MPASFADQPRRDDPVQGRRDDGLDLVEAMTGVAALAAIAELATGDGSEPVREDAIGLNQDDVVAAEEEDTAQADTEDEAPEEKD